MSCHTVTQPCNHKFTSSCHIKKPEFLVILHNRITLCDCREIISNVIYVTIWWTYWFITQSSLFKLRLTHYHYKCTYFKHETSLYGVDQVSYQFLTNCISSKLLKLLELIDHDLNIIQDHVIAILKNFILTSNDKFIGRKL